MHKPLYFRTWHNAQRRHIPTGLKRPMWKRMLSPNVCRAWQLILFFVCLFQVSKTVSICYDKLRMKKKQSRFLFFTSNFRVAGLLDFCLTILLHSKLWTVTFTLEPFWIYFPHSHLTSILHMMSCHSHSLRPSVIMSSPLSVPCPTIPALISPVCLFSVFPIYHTNSNCWIQVCSKKNK